jgi:gluconolactonase
MTAPYGSLEGTGFEPHDPRWHRLVPGPEKLERLWSGARWCEGPAWFPAHRTLVWSDIPNNRMLRWDECSGGVSVFRSPADNANGHTVDRQGRLVSCEHLSRRVTRTEHDGRITVLASHWRGMRLNSPNDVVVHSDGGIWFTDPSYGILSDYEGLTADSEIGACHVYRIDPASGEVELVADDFLKPNGLAFSPDESVLYIADTGASHAADGPRHIRAFQVEAGGRRLRGGDVFAECGNGMFDGFRVDTQGRIWTSAGDGVHALHPDGSLLGKILVPERVANVCFGGARRNRLFICATSSLYAIHLNANGA